MRYRIFSAPAMTCLLIALALGALTLGPFMRETDQAWLLDGGMAIAKGHPQIACGEYSYDKQFISYFMPSLLDRCLPRPFVADTLVYAGNIFGFAFFWGALWLLFARSARRLSLAVVLPLILTPAFLLYSPFYASAFTSAAFVFLLATYLDRSNWNWFSRMGIFVLAFLAVGARADAMFILPLLAMLHSPRRDFSSALFSPNTWLLATGGLTAFFLGRAMYTNFSVDHVGNVFRAKQVLGYLVFGFGATGLLFTAALHASFLARKPAARRAWIFFLSLGLLLSMAYYFFQLLSPRHCTLGAVAVAVFACAKRGRAIFQSYFHTRFSGGALKLVLVASALTPMFAGVNLANLHHPKISFLQPTLLPSAAGVAPAGGYLGFLIFIKAQKGILDHNQAVWMAARDTKYKSDAQGAVPYLYSPVESYFNFAIRLQNEIPQQYSLSESIRLPPAFYCESRSLMRYQYAWPSSVLSSQSFFATYKLMPTTSVNWHGITVVQCMTNALNDTEISGGALWALSESFGPDEFRLEPLAALKKIPAEWSGKKITLVSQGELRVNSSLAQTKRTVCDHVLGCWNLVEFPAAAIDSEMEALVSDAKIFVGVGAFPAWMTLRKK